MPDSREISLGDVIWINPERMSGAPCFTGTRVPVQALVDHLKGGSTLSDFLEGFPSVTREQAVAFLELGKNELVRCASS